ncbi:estrogen receptor binding protein [Acanthamoeba castellanii str. Neff]|uniref:Estrogen receptor binding protein n=1 Tax=Acanthamoeba castellanii (strain ATCC 30010 / Neff) TaxID=1257118 RepID=L8HFY2_ACACF|nr:estrogen receptor binding protein [Acanthamoeba castellanii str. Neff]ELR23623.1 estrogen receptor binding protein [Acanthamoeba castellanii str. Neff]
MDDEFISFGSAEDNVEEEEVEEQENEETESGADYNIEDILKKAAITVKRQLDKLELESGKISFGTDGKALTPDAAATKPAKHKGKDLHLESGYEKTRLYLKEVREDKNKTVGMPSAVDLKSSSNLRREVKKPRKGVKHAWGFMRTPRLTAARKLEYKVILLRSQLDPTRRYKRMPEKIPKVFQIGRVVSGAGEFYSGRMTRKETKKSLVRTRAKRKYAEVEKDRNSGRRDFVKKRKEDRMPKWKKNM